MDIKIVKKSTNYWVVRAGVSAEFFNHFKTAGVIAIGHMDGVDFSLIDPKSESCLDEIEVMMRERAKNKNEAPHVTTSQVSQVKRFISDLAVGDLVFTLESDSVLVGKVISAAYLDRTEIKLSDGKGGFKSKSMPLGLRRDVEWSEIRGRDSLPIYVKSSLSSQQTVFSLEQHKSLLNHWLYSMFMTEDSLYFTTKVGERNSIGQFDITELQRIIQKLELLTNKICDGNIESYIDADNFSQLERDYIKYGLESGFALTTKNSFMSPGHIWNGFEAPEKKRVILAMLVAGVLGGTVDAKESSLVSDLEKKQVEKVVELITKKTPIEVYKEKLKIKLEKPAFVKPTSKQHEQQPTDKKKRTVIFPSTSEDGDVGI